jgi:hypothetical protein
LELASGDPFFFAGIWRAWPGVRGTKKELVEGEHELFSFLATWPNNLVEPVHKKAMPVIGSMEDAEVCIDKKQSSSRNRRPRECSGSVTQTPPPGNWEGLFLAGASFGQSDNVLSAAKFSPRIEERVTLFQYAVALIGRFDPVLVDVSQGQLSYK